MPGAPLAPTYGSSLDGLRRNAVLNVIAVAGSATGVAALALPFAGATSPLGAIAFAFDLEDSAVALVLALAIPALLAVPITLWNVARLLSPDSGGGERKLAYGAATAAMLAVLPVTAIAIAEQAFTDPESIVALLTYWAAIVANVALLRRNHRRGAPHTVTTEAFLLLAYAPGTLYALIAFSHIEFFSTGPRWLWEPGAYAVLAALLLYIAQAVLLLKNR